MVTWARIGAFSMRPPNTIRVGGCRGSFRLLCAHSLLATGFWIASSGSCFALTLEQARGACIESVGRPNVQACMQSLKGGGGDREANLAKCRAGVIPKVRACVMAALNKANARANVAITIEGGAKKEVVDLSRALPAGFVPPPRTIKDIASVLDSEKPDPRSHAVMKAQADAEPTPGSPNSATFYYNRGKARLALGRADEALSDAQKAVQAAGRCPPRPSCTAAHRHRQGAPG